LQCSIFVAIANYLVNQARDWLSIAQMNGRIPRSWSQFEATLIRTKPITWLGGFLERSRFFNLLFWMGLVSQLLLQSANAQTKYTITPLVPLTGVTSEATAINSRGVVAGNYTWRSTGVQHGFFYDGVMHDIGSTQTIKGGNVTGINDCGIVIGWAATGAGYDPSNGYFEIDTAFAVYRRNYLVLANDSNSSYGQNFANGINSAGHIVGSALDYAYIWRNGVRTFLPHALYFYPHAINNNDEITGQYFFRLISPISLHAAIYTAGNYLDLGALPNSVQSVSEGLAINDHGQVVGSSFTGATSQAVLFSGGTVLNIDTITKDVPTQASLATSINNSGVVVGNILINEPNATFTTLSAFVYVGGKMQDLNTLIAPNSGWVINSANAINNAGQIVGGGTFNGEKGFRAYLLTPIK
jgi:probable HAF family extracellular repeat protein